MTSDSGWRRVDADDWPGVALIVFLTAAAIALVTWGDRKPTAPDVTSPSPMVAKVSKFPTGLDTCRAENGILQKDVKSLRLNNNTLAQQNLDMLETENRWCEKLLKRINLDGGK